MKTTKKILSFIFLLLITSLSYSQNYFNTSNAPYIATFYPNPPDVLINGKIYFDLETIASNTNTGLLDISMGINTKTSVSPDLKYYRKGEWNANLGNGNFSSNQNFFFDELYVNSDVNSIKGSIFVKLRDNSSKKDLVIARSNQLQVHWNQNNIITGSQQNIGGDANLITKGKFNFEDTREDVAIKNGSNVLIYQNQGDGYLNSVPSSFPYNVTNFKLRQMTDVVDENFPANSADRDDIIFYNSSDNIIYVYKNNNSNGFISAPMAVISNVGYPIVGFEVADIDNDGYNDIIVAGSSYPNLKVTVYKNLSGVLIYNNPIVAFTTSYFIQNPWIITGDLNKDGFNDLVFVGYEGATGVYINTKTTPVFNNAPSQMFYSLYPSDEPNQVALADIYNKGGLALIAAHENTVYHHQGVRVINAVTFDPAPAPPIIKGDLYQDGSVFRPKLILKNRNERDFNRYDIYKSSPGTGGVITYIGQTSTTYFIDYSETVIVGGTDRPNYNCFYFAKQVDLTAHVSVASNYAYYTVGVLTCTACAEGPDSQTNINTVKPKEYSISNFPNPFNPTTKIYFGIPYKGNVKIEVYNSTGQKIKELLNEDRDPGNYVTEFNGSDYSSGVYFYKIESGNFIQTKRMILLK